jgi:hypothetical protein
MKEVGGRNRTPMREATGHERPSVPVDNMVEVSSYGAGLESSHSTSAIPRKSLSMVCSLA